MKPFQLYFHMVLFVLYVVLTFESVDEILWCYRSNETSSAVLSHGNIYVVVTFKSVVEILWCYHSNETSSAVLSHGTICFIWSSNSWVCGWNPMVLPFKWNVLGRTLAWYYLFSRILQNEVLLFGGSFFVSSPKGENGSIRTRVCPCTIRLQTWSAGPEVAAPIPGAEPILRVLK